MLRYSFKLGRDTNETQDLEWNDRYVSQDLSFFSGTTSPSSHLDSMDRINVEYSKNESHAPFNIRTERVSRNGYVIFTKKEYEVKDETYTFYDDMSGSELSGSYIEICGKRVFKNSEDKFVITHFPYEFTVGDVRYSDVTAEETDGVVKLDSVYYVEGGFVNIDSRYYAIDFDAYSPNGTIGAIEDLEGNFVGFNEICRCSGLKIVRYPSPVDIIRFRAYPSEFEDIKFSSMFLCDRHDEVLYNNKIYDVVKAKGDDDIYVYRCFMEDGTGYDVWFDDDGNEEGGYVSIATEDKISEYIPKYGGTLLEVGAFIDKDGERVYVKPTVMYDELGTMVGINLNSPCEYISVGDKVVVSVSDPPTEVLVDSISDDRFVMHKGTRYDVIKNLMRKVVSPSGEEYLIVKDVDEGKVLVNIDGDFVPMSVSNGKAKRYGYGVLNRNSAADEMTYDIKDCDGVVVNGIRYEVMTSMTTDDQGNEVPSYQSVTIDDNDELIFDVVSYVSANLMICKAHVDEMDFTEDFANEYARRCAVTVANNADRVHLRKMNEALYHRELTNRTVYYYMANDGTNIYDRILWEDLRPKISNAYATLRLGMVTQGGEDPLQDDITESMFFEEEKEKAINRIVDMEKDVYSPKVAVGQEFSGADTKYKPIYEIDLNLHFRTRDVDPSDPKSGSWKILDDKNDNWFVMDYYPYSGYSNKDELMEASDLMGLLFFTDTDVLYQKSSISRSFVRLSFYDSTNPQTQSLLATSCVYMDVSSMYKRYTDNSRKVKGQYEMISRGDVDRRKCLNKVSVFAEKMLDKKCSNSSSVSAIDFSKDKRIGSDITIKNKYESNGSSEGFYIYIFREYASGLYPKPIYMKAEFNHAGVGRTIPLVIPMHWNKDSEEDGYSYYHPTERLTIGDEMASGTPVACVASQLYVPLYAVYDYKEKEYGYVFDDRYVTVEDGVAKLNLFELKIMDESGLEYYGKDIYSVNVNDFFKNHI